MFLNTQEHNPLKQQSKSTQRETLKSSKERVKIMRENFILSHALKTKTHTMRSSIVFSLLSSLNLQKSRGIKMKKAQPAKEAFQFHNCHFPNDAKKRN